MHFFTIKMKLGLNWWRSLSFLFHTFKRLYRLPTWVNFSKKKRLSGIISPPPPPPKKDWITSRETLSSERRPRTIFKGLVHTDAFSQLIFYNDFWEQSVKVRTFDKNLRKAKKTANNAICSHWKIDKGTSTRYNGCMSKKRQENFLPVHNSWV